MTNEPQKTQNVNLYMTPGLWYQVGIIAAIKKTTKRAILEEALQEYIAKKLPKEAKKVPVYQYFKKDLGGGEIAVLTLADNGNYSIATNLDPEPVGYTNHQWRSLETEKWKEITPDEACEIVGYSLEED